MASRRPCLFSKWVSGTISEFMSLGKKYNTIKFIKGKSKDPNLYLKEIKEIIDKFYSYVEIYDDFKLDTFEDFVDDTDFDIYGYIVKYLIIPINNLKPGNKNYNDEKPIDISILKEYGEIEENSYCFKITLHRHITFE